MKRKAEQKSGTEKKQRIERDCDIPEVILESLLQGRCPEQYYEQLRKEKCEDADKDKKIIGEDPLNYMPIAPKRLVRVRNGPKLRCYDAQSLMRWFGQHKQPKDPYSHRSFTDAEVQEIERIGGKKTRWAYRSQAAESALDRLFRECLERENQLESQREWDYERPAQERKEAEALAEEWHHWHNHDLIPSEYWQDKYFGASYDTIKGSCRYLVPRTAVLPGKNVGDVVPALVYNAERKGYDSTQLTLTSVSDMTVADVRGKAVPAAGTWYPERANAKYLTFQTEQGDSVGFPGEVCDVDRFRNVSDAVFEAEPPEIPELTEIKRAPRLTKAEMLSNCREQLMQQVADYAPALAEQRTRGKSGSRKKTARRVRPG